MARTLGWGWDRRSAQSLPKTLTCSEVNDDVNEKDGVRDAVEDHPSHGEVIVEEGDGNGKYDKVGHKE